MKYSFESETEQQDDSVRKMVGDKVDLPITGIIYKPKILFHKPDLLDVGKTAIMDSGEF